MDSKKQKLERVLRLSVKQAETDLQSKSSSLVYQKVLEAIRLFLTKWETLGGEEVHTELKGKKNCPKRTRGLPDDYLRIVFCRMLSNLDPLKSANLVRQHVLSILRSVETAVCRQIALDFLLAVTRTCERGNDNNHTWSERETKKGKKEIFSCLKDVFENDQNSLLQILRFFSTVLGEVPPRQQILFPKDVFHYIIGILPKVPETNLHVALRCLIRYVDSTEDARLAVDSVRTELALLEKTDISDMATVAFVFEETVRGGKRSEALFLEEYVVVVEELINERNNERENKEYQSRAGKVANVELELLTFDLVMMIIAKENIVHRERIVRMVSDGSLLESGLLSASHASKVVELVENGCDSVRDSAESFNLSHSNSRTRLLESLIDFYMAILLTPLRCAIAFDRQQFFSKVRLLLIDTVFALPEDFQIRTISIALTTIDKLMIPPKMGEIGSTNKDRLKTQGDSTTQICLNIFLLLLSVTSKKINMLMRFQNDLIGTLMSESFDRIQNFGVLQALCTLIAKVVSNNKPSGQLDCIAICRSLLFSTPRLGTVISISQTQEHPISRVTRGLMFANAIVSCCELDSAGLVTVQKMVSKILLSPHLNVFMMDPSIGLHGMKVIRHLREDMNCHDHLGKDLFQLTSRVLSHSRVVHYPDESSKILTTKTTSVLVFNEMPSLFSLEDQTIKRRRFRKMIFCFNSFFTHEAILTHPSKWERSSSLIFELIDTYLALGRTAKWNPRAWIFARVEFPGSSSSTLITKKRKEKLFYLFNSNLSRLGCSQNNSKALSRMDKQIMQLIKEASTISEKEAFIDSAYRFTLTSLFALSASTAVLFNAYDHYKDLFEVDCVLFEKKKEALRMIQYQFTKIYDLKNICQSMKRLFQNLGSRSHNAMQKRSKNRKSRRLNRTSSTETMHEIQDKAELAALHLAESLKKLVRPKEAIPREIFWNCLTDSSHDTFIISVVKNFRQSETIEPILEIVQFRLNIIEHLVKTSRFNVPKKEDGNQTHINENSSTCRGHIARCLHLTSFLLGVVPSIEQATRYNSSMESLIRLTAEYLGLACAILISKSNVDQNSETSNAEFFQIFGLYLLVIGHKQPFNQALESRTNRYKVTTKDFKTLVSSFEDNIRGYHGSVASQILETLSVFAARSGSSILHYMIDIHWNTTFLSKYTNEINKEIVDPPFVLVKLLKSISRCDSQRYMNWTTEDCCAYQTIDKLIKRRLDKSMEKNQYLIHSMCRHWGLIALSSNRRKLFVEFLSTLLGKLVEYLTDVNDNFIGHRFSSRKGEEESCEADDDDEYLPPSTSTTLVYKPPVIPTSCNFSCLTSLSYPIYFDMLLRTTVSSLALFSVPEAMSGVIKPVITSRRLHPVYELESMATVYGSLVNLYNDKLHIFPKSLLSSFATISKCMLEVSITKLQEYVEWRNCQPVLHPEDLDAGVFDLASTMFLKNLIDILGLHVVGTLRTFCFSHSESSSGQDNKKMPTQKHTNYRKASIPTINSLARKVERTFEYLSKTSNRYNTGEIATDNTAQRALQREREESTKDARLLAESSLESEHSSITEETLGSGAKENKIKGIMNQSVERKEGSDRITRPMSVGNGNPSDSEDEESFRDDFDEEESSSSGSDAFGVSGDWGQDTDGSDKEYDPEILVDRFEKSR